MTCLWSEFEVLFRQLAHVTPALRATMTRVDEEMVQRDIDAIDLVGSSLVCLLQVVYGRSVDDCIHKSRYSPYCVLHRLTRRC